MKKIIRIPELNTVWMVERTLADLKKPVNLTELKSCLPRQVQHQSLNLILDYLQYSKKIHRTSKGIEWIFTEGNGETKIIKKLSPLLKGRER